jgi:hypothetical protein
MAGPWIARGLALKSLRKLALRRNQSRLVFHLPLRMWFRHFRDACEQHTKTRRLNGRSADCRLTQMKKGQTDSGYNRTPPRLASRIDEVEAGFAQRTWRTRRLWRSSREPAVEMSKWRKKLPRRFSAFFRKSLRPWRALREKQFPKATDSTEPRRLF